MDALAKPPVAVVVAGGGVAAAAAAAETAKAPTLEQRCQTQGGFITLAEANKHTHAHTSGQCLCVCVCVPSHVHKLYACFYSGLCLAERRLS